jgi:hypothetical protein
MDPLRLFTYSIALAIAGMTVIILRSLDDRRFSMASLLCLTTLFAVTASWGWANFDWPAIRKEERRR